jgi:hypothetical protein
MGYSFSPRMVRRMDAMEVVLTCFGAGAFCAGRVALEEAFCAPLRRLRREPQNGLQMAGAISGWGRGGAGQSVASTAPLCASKAGVLEALRAADASSTSLLGRSKNPLSPARVASAQAAPGRAHDRPLVVRTGIGRDASAPRAAWPHRPASRTDYASAAAPSLDGRFQRLVPDPRRPTPGAAYGA